MRYTFKDIDSNEIYSKSLVLFVMGSYAVFNQYAQDKMKLACEPPREENEFAELFREFGIVAENSRDTSNIVEFSEFQDVCRAPCMNGKWFCALDFMYIANNKKKVDWLEAYFRKPSKSAILVVTCSDFWKYRRYLKMACFGVSSIVNTLSLSFPSRRNLEKFVDIAFKKRGKKAEERAIALFIDRVSMTYDEYDMLIDKVCSENTGNVIKYEHVISSLEGIDYYEVDDLIRYIIRPMGSPKIALQRKVYKAMGSLVNDIGAVKTLDKLQRAIEKFIEYRVQINNGNIPVKIKYSVPEIKGRLNENLSITKAGKYAFKTGAEISSSTSLADWVYMRNILSNANKYSEISCTRAIYEVIHRSLLRNGMLDSAAGLGDIFDFDIRELDSEITGID